MAGEELIVVLSCLFADCHHDRPYLSSAPRHTFMPGRLACRERPALAGVYKIAGEMPGKFLRQNGLRGGSVYDLTHDRGVAIKAEQGEQALLEGISAGQAADG